MAQGTHHHTFPNGLTLLLERMEHVRSAALYFLVPAGCIYDPPAHLGVASVLSDMITRGAGQRDSRELALALDNLGVDRDESVGGLHMHFWGATLARNLPAALDIYSDILLRPHIPEDEIEAVQALALQDIQSLEDEPRQKVLIELRKHHYPPPLGQDRRGTVEGIKSLNAGVVRNYYKQLFRPRGTILSVAGNVDWEPLRDQVGRLFGGWAGGADPTVTYGAQPPPIAHITKETTQTQIALAYPSVPVGDPDYYSAQGAVNVLSGGMSSRLFTEIREKEGLCYAVWARYSTFKDRASVMCYAGSTNDRAQRTLDLLFRELKRIKDGIEPEEVTRLQAGLKSSLIMQQESTYARAGALASDWYFLGRVRSFDEIQAAIDGLSPEGIVTHLRRCPPRDFSVVTLGPKPLELNQ